MKMIHPCSLMDLTGFQMALGDFPADIISVFVDVLVDQWNEEMTRQLT